jgi:hypothetical protein
MSSARFAMLCASAEGYEILSREANEKGKNTIK